MLPKRKYFGGGKTAPTLNFDTSLTTGTGLSLRNKGASIDPTYTNLQSFENTSFGTPFDTPNLGIASNSVGGGGSSSWQNFLDQVSKTDPTRFIGDAAALLNFQANKRSIDKMPITQPYKMVQPALIDKTRQDAQAIADARRAGRMGVLAARNSGVNATRLGNLSAIAGAQTGNQIGQIRAAENQRLAGIDVANVGATNQAEHANTSVFNQNMADINHNKFLQEQQRVNNRNMLTQSLLGNQYQRMNQDLEYDKMAMASLVDMGRGAVDRRLLENEAFLNNLQNSALADKLRTIAEKPISVTYNSNYTG